MKIKICDLCNEPIIDDLGSLKVKIYEKPYDYGSIKLDICHFCKEEIIKRSKEAREKGE